MTAVQDIPLLSPATWPTAPFTDDELARFYNERQFWSVVCPAYKFIEPEVEHILDQLQALGIHVTRYAGETDIYKSRCKLATMILERGWRRTLWLDSDTLLMPEDCVRLLLDPEPLVSALSPARGTRRFLVDFGDLTDVVLGLGGTRAYVPYVGFGCIVTGIEVLRDLTRLPDVQLTTEGFYSFFGGIRLAHPTGGVTWLSEDYSFCERAREAGHRVMLDCSYRVGHIGRQVYHWEHVAGAFGDPSRFASTVNVKLRRGA